MRTDPSGMSTLMGYEFYWRHASDMRGGDQIIVGVDNQSRNVCTQWGGTTCAGRECLNWQTFYDQRTNFAYRLWRKLGVVPQGTSPPPPAISSAQAFKLASSQPAVKGMVSLGSFIGYTYSYWTPPYWSTDNTAYPAYNFYYSSGTRLTVDALSGQIREVGR